MKYVCGLITFKMVHARVNAPNTFIETMGHVLIGLNPKSQSFQFIISQFESQFHAMHLILNHNLLLQNLVEIS